VLRGDVRCPSYGGGWQQDDIDLSAHLAKYRDHEVGIVIASVWPAGQMDKTKYVCGICGCALTDAKEGSRCKIQTERTARGLWKRQQRDELLTLVRSVVQ
jgi:hypothetical protein